MCLIKAYNQQEEADKIFNGRKEITCYKVLNKNLHSIYYSQKYLPGINRADRVVQGADWVNNSIHVYTNWETAKMHACPWHTILPVICRRSQLVAVGEKNEAAFKQVRVRRRDYESALRK